MAGFHRGGAALVRAAAAPKGWRQLSQTRQLSSNPKKLSVVPKECTIRESVYSTAPAGESLQFCCGIKYRREEFRVASTGFEHLPYSGESAQDRVAYDRYLADAKRGKTALQMKAVADQLISDLRRSWAPRSFTGVSTSVGEFDATVCNVSYHFHTHGQKYGSIRLYTDAAKRYFEQHGRGAVADAKGLIRLPLGVFDRAGRIVTYFG